LGRQAGLLLAGCLAPCLAGWLGNLVFGKTKQTQQTLKNTTTKNSAITTPNNIFVLNMCFGKYVAQFSFIVSL